MEWETTTSKPRFAADKLASISIEVPLNLRTAEGFGLLVALWCGIVRDRLTVEDTSHDFSFGFHAGEIVVEVHGGRIANEGRLQIEAGRFKIVQSESDLSKKDGQMGGQVGFDLSKLLGLGKTEFNVGGHLNRTVSKAEQKDGEHYQVFWRLADAGYNFWRVFGMGLNAEGVLENKIIGDEPLCHIVAEDPKAIDVVVSFRCDLRDLWFLRKDDAKHIRDKKFSVDQDERNRSAVAARVISKAITGYGKGVSIEDRAVVLARQKLTANKAKDK